MRTLRLILRYDGTGYAGSQRQANAETIEGALESAWLRCTGLTERIRLAGRTDAGVHATGQAGSVRTETNLEVADLLRLLNQTLPHSISIMSLDEMRPGFDARRDALSRTYEYRLAGTYGEYVDLASMRRAAREFVGEHDFRAFSSSGPVGPRGYVRRIFAADVAADDREGATLRLTGDAFLRQMVRRMASALIMVGTGRIAAAEMVRALRMGRRELLPGPAKAENLTLVEVGYGDIGA